MPRRRIAIVFEFSTLNGGERSMLSVLDSLQKQEGEFEFVAIGPGQGRLSEAFRERMVPLAAWSPFDDAGSRRSDTDIENSLVRLIESLKPDLVHGNSLAMSRLLGRISGRLTVPTSGHLRDIIKLSKAAIADLNENQLLVAVSSATKEFHVRQEIDERRVTTVHNGVDLERFQPRPATGWLCEELGLGRFPNGGAVSAGTESVSDSVGKVKLIACIGQIGLRKGQDVLATAAPLIAAQVPQVHFLIIGERTSGKAESIQFEQDLRERFAEHGLSSRLHLLGHREDVARILNEVDLLVHPANQEPYGRVLLEASASGLPIVATDVGGTPEIVINGTTGYLVPAREPELLAEAVVNVLSNEEESRRLRQNSRQRAVDEFSVEVAAGRLALMWNRILPNPIHAS